MRQQIKTVTTYYLSKAARADLYKAISKPIMDLRIEALKKNLTKDEVDGRLFNLETGIWKSVAEILKIKNP